MKIYNLLDRSEFARDLYVSGMGARGDPKKLGKEIRKHQKD